MAIEFGPVTPIFRIFDEVKAREFYLGFLDFKVDWEHRFNDNAPLYMQISRGTFKIHLSEHHGDGAPASMCTVGTSSVDELHVALRAKSYKYNRPGIQLEFGKHLTVIDPFHNQIRFYEEEKPKQRKTQTGKIPPTRKKTKSRAKSK